MNNLIFWIIVCSWLIPMGIRMYNRSRRRRVQDRGFQDPGQPYPPQQFPGQQFPSQQPYPAQFPAGDGGTAVPPSSTVPPAPATGGEEQGFRARRLAELDAKFSNGEIAMEDYMKLRQEIMNG